MLRVVFMGTPAFAVATFRCLLAAGHEIVAVYTRAPRPAGRGMEEKKSPVHLAADAAGLPVRAPTDLKVEAEQRAFAAQAADVAVVVAYGLILPRGVLEAPRAGCLNLHASALPRWRGAAPIQRAIMAGDTETAATVMRMDEGLDTGPICAVEPIAITPDMTAGELHELMATRGAALMVRALSQLERHELACTPQAAHGASYAPKIGKEDTRLDFLLPAEAVHNRVRGLSPLPGAWLEIVHQGRRERVKVLRTVLTEGAGPPGSVIDDALTIACGRGAVRVVSLQRSGKRAMTAAEFLRGLQLPPGTRVGAPG
jgi:methionyl-tRNA formyltransferase